MTLDEFIQTEPPAGSVLWTATRRIADKSISKEDGDEEIGAKCIIVI